VLRNQYENICGVAYDQLLSNVLSYQFDDGQLNELTKGFAKLQSDVRSLSVCLIDLSKLYNETLCRSPSPPKMSVELKFNKNFIRYFLLHIQAEARIAEADVSNIFSVTLLLLLECNYHFCECSSAIAGCDVLPLLLFQFNENRESVIVVNIDRHRTYETVLCDVLTSLFDLKINACEYRHFCSKETGSSTALACDRLLENGFDINKLISHITSLAESYSKLNKKAEKNFLSVLQFILNVINKILRLKPQITVVQIMQEAKEHLKKLSSTTLTFLPFVINGGYVLKNPTNHDDSSVPNNSPKCCIDNVKMLCCNLERRDESFPTNRCFDTIKYFDNKCSREKDFLRKYSSNLMNVVDDSTEHKIHDENIVENFWNYGDISDFNSNQSDAYLYTSGNCIPKKYEIGKNEVSPLSYLVQAVIGITALSTPSSLNTFVDRTYLFRNYVPNPKAESCWLSCAIHFFVIVLPVSASCYVSRSKSGLMKPRISFPLHCAYINLDVTTLFEASFVVENLNYLICNDDELNIRNNCRTSQAHKFLVVYIFNFFVCVLYLQYLTYYC
jgi:hypothetical protein